MFHAVSARYAYHLCLNLPATFLNPLSSISFPAQYIGVRESDTYWYCNKKLLVSAFGSYGNMKIISATFRHGNDELG